MNKEILLSLSNYINEHFGFRVKVSSGDYLEFMDYLDDLNDATVIFGKEYLASEILYKIDEFAFMDLFSDWYVYTAYPDLNPDRGRTWQQVASDDYGIPLSGEF